MLLEGLIIGIFLSLLSNGDLRNLKTIRINYFPLLLLAFFLRYLGLYIGVTTLVNNVFFGRTVVLISLLMLIWVQYKNFHIVGMRILFLGTLSNFLVMVLNQGAMPVHEGLAFRLGIDEFLGKEYITHIPMDSLTRLSFLGDVIPIPYPFLQARILSIGDIILTIGIIRIIYYHSYAKRLSFSDQSAKIK